MTTQPDNNGAPRRGRPPIRKKVEMSDLVESNSGDSAATLAASMGVLQQPVEHKRATEAAVGKAMVASSPAPTELAPEEEDEEEEEEEGEDEEEDEDDDEEDEGEDGDADDEDEEEEQAAPVPAPPPRRPRGRPPRQPQQQASPSESEEIVGQRPSLTSAPLPLNANPRLRIQQQHQELDDELADVMTGLDFNDKAFKVYLHRLEPSHYKGQQIAGFLETFAEKPKLEDLRNKYGGGKYKVTVIGPPAPGAKPRIRAAKVITIAGRPIPPDGVDSDEDKKPAPPDNTANLNLVEQTLRAQEKLLQQVYQEKQSLQKTMMEAMAKNEQILTQAMNPSGLREEMREERKAAEERSREERRIAEEKAREEREIRRMELEEQRRQWDQQRAEEQRRHEKEMEKLRLEMMKSREEGRTTAELQLKMMQEMEREKESRNQLLFQMMQESNKQTMLMMQEQNKQAVQQLQQLEQMKSEFLLKQLELSKDNKGLSGMLGDIVQLKEVMEMFNGNSDGKEPWEKMLEKGAEVAPAIAAAMSGAFRGQQPSAPAIKPNSVAVAEPPPVPRKRKPAMPKRGEVNQRASAWPAASPQPAAAAQPQVETPAAPQVQTNQPVPTPQPEMPKPNPLTEFVFAEPGDDNEMVVRKLVCDIDLALQRDYSVQKIYEEVVKKFPSDILVLLKMAGVKQCIDLLSTHAPETWVVNSTKGARTIEQLHMLLSAQK